MTQQTTALIAALSDIAQTAAWSAMPAAGPNEMRDTLQAIAKAAREAIAQAKAQR